MKTIAMVVVMMMASTCFAETDAEKIARLEQENVTLRNEVARVKQANAILQRRIESLTRPAPAPEKVAAEPAKVAKRFASIAAMLKAIPVEVNGTKNAAAGEPFSAEKWNAWAKENLVGAEVTLPSVYFFGKVERDGDGFRFSVYDETTIVCHATASSKAALAGMSEGDFIRVIGTLSTLTVMTSPNGVKVYKVALSDCDVKKVKSK